MAYNINGGEHGNYKVTEDNKFAPVAFVLRNQTGGGYTVQSADESKSIQMHNLPATDTSGDQASEIMKLLHAT